MDSITANDAMYEEMVTVSVLLIQRLWRDKLKERRRKESQK